jgi:hypothetical protein
LKIIGKIFFYFFVLLILLAGIPYIICPFYKFPEATEFKGDKIYNPYEGMDSSRWHKANFHAHTRMLYGITDGRKTSTEKLIEMYKKFNFDIIGISDYMFLNRESAVPVYEHGYGLLKNHALIFGSKKVNWLDMMFNQNIHNKQFLINQLKDDNNIYAVAHPSLRGAFNPEDFRYLTNYDLIEVLRFDRLMIEFLDTALSTGHKVFLLADDDMHDIENSREVAQSYNMINCDSLTTESIFTAIKNGKSFGVKTLTEIQSFESKIEDSKKNPIVNSITLNGSKISFNFSSAAKEIKFIGQNGSIKKIISDNSYADYDFKPEDTYIRTEVLFDKVKYYFNPFIRYDGSFEIKRAEIDFWKTLIYRVIIIFAFCFTAIIIYRRRKRHKKSSL